MEQIDKLKQIEDAALKLAASNWKDAQQQADIQKKAYEYVMQNCGSHYMPNIKLYTAHITLGFDYQKYGNSELEAKDTLASCLCIIKYIQEVINGK